MVRLFFNQYTTSHHRSFEFAAIYWHFPFASESWITIGDFTLGRRIRRCGLVDCLHNRVLLGRQFIETMNNFKIRFFSSSTPSDLPKILQDITVGHLLGDMCVVQKYKHNKRFYLQFAAGSMKGEKYKEDYCRYVYSNYKKFCNMTGPSYYAPTGSFSFSQSRRSEASSEFYKNFGLFYLSWNIVLS